MPEDVKDHELLTVVEEPNGHLAMSNEFFLKHIDGCAAVISCLGHTLSFKGIYGKPRRLCLDTTRKICESIETLSPTNPVKFIVISTEGVSRLDGMDPNRGCFERCIINCCLKNFLPPHADNMDVVQYLHENIEKNNNRYVEFCAVRPSDLTDGDQCSYELHETLQNGIFNAPSTSRANVGNFMADCVTVPDIWSKYKNSYPHIINTRLVMGPKVIKRE
uniref:NAD(P)-binding domain-containing protein n=1 Tax=Octactis speculum TaxID=3111310 RepID=A0A7S2C2W7_9STRA